MRIGIVMDFKSSDGGLYQYSMTMLNALNEIKKSGQSTDEFIIFAGERYLSDGNPIKTDNFTVKHLVPQTIKRKTINLLKNIVGNKNHIDIIKNLRRNKITKTVSSYMAERLMDPDRIRSNPEMNRRFTRCGIDLMLYPAPNSLSFESGIPYIMAIHDLQHRLHPEFPEVSKDGEWEWREYLFRNACRNAAIILADSEVGKEDILDIYGEYGITPDRVKILPFLPATSKRIDVSEKDIERIRAKYDLPERYIFYPAQFWPHKNHIRIIEALALIKEKHGIKIPIVFCGSYGDDIREKTFKKVTILVDQKGISDQIHHLGYAPDSDMSALYAGARALIMPTFFGPTNIPVLEAWSFDCPVLTSDIRGIREQAGDAALLANPNSVPSIADGIYRLWTDNKLCKKLIKHGQKRLNKFTSDDFNRSVVEILEKIKKAVSQKNISKS